MAAEEFTFKGWDFRQFSSEATSLPTTGGQVELMHFEKVLGNCILQGSTDAPRLMQRPGFLMGGSNGTSEAVTWRVLGGHFWEATGLIYFVVYNGASFILKSHVANGTGSYTDVQTLGTINELKVQFLEYFNGSTQSLLLFTGEEGWVIDTGGTATEITDGDFPTPHSPKAAVMNGYIFIFKSGTADIFNCAPADPTTWQASTFMRCEMEGATGIGLVVKESRLLAFTTKGIEHFKDGAIPSPNSPLLREHTLYRHETAVNWKCIQSFGDTVYFIGKLLQTPEATLFEYSDKVKELSSQDMSYQIRTVGATWASFLGLMVFNYLGRHLIAITRFSTTATSLSIPVWAAPVYDPTYQTWYMWHASFNSAVGISTLADTGSNPNRCQWPAIEGLVYDNTNFSSYMVPMFVYTNGTAAHAGNFLSAAKDADGYYNTPTFGIESVIVFPASTRNSGARKFWRDLEIVWNNRANGNGNSNSGTVALYYIFEPDTGTETGTGIAIVRTDTMATIRNFHRLGSGYTLKFHLRIIPEITTAGKWSIERIRLHSTIADTEVETK